MEAESAKADWNLTSRRTGVRTDEFLDMVR